LKISLKCKFLAPLWERKGEGACSSLCKGKREGF